MQRNTLVVVGAIAAALLLINKQGQGKGSSTPVVAQQRPGGCGCKS